MPTIFMPSIIERSSRGERTYDIYSRLLMDRIVFSAPKSTTTSPTSSSRSCSFSRRTIPGKEISVYLNCPGGSVSAGLAMYDTMKHITSPVSTICMGFAASMGCFMLAAAGTKGKRYALPHARIMMHQPSGGAQGVAADIEIAAKEILYLRSRVNRLMADCTGQPLERIERDFDRDYYMSADEAKAYGIIDEVIVRRDAADPGKVPLSAR